MPKRNLKPPNLAGKIKNKTPKKPKSIVREDKDVKPAKLNVKTSIAKALDKGLGNIQKDSLEADKVIKKQQKDEGYDISDCAGGSICLAKSNQGARKTITLDSNDWVFTSADAITSFNVLEDGHTLTQNSLPYINKKREGITTEDLIKYYDTFIGAFVFLNHKQDLKIQKGVILDAVLRSIKVGTKEDGSEEELMYCRALMAINRHDDPLVYQAVKDGRLKYVSMGSWYANKMCSRCGAKGLRTDTNDTRCVHLKLALGERYMYQDGDSEKVTQITELWDDTNNKGQKVGIGFFELSLLSSMSPAWNGAGVSELETVDLGDKQIEIELDEIYLKKPAFKKYIGNKQIVVLDPYEANSKNKQLKEAPQKKPKNSMFKY